MFDVTGGTRGIGKGIARVLVRAGARVVIVGRSADDAAACVEDLAALGPGGVSHVAADVSTVAGCRAVAEATASRHGGIDVVCANAGCYPPTPVDRMTEADFDAMVAANLKSTVFTVQACLPHLIVSGRGRVVLTSSITGPITGMAGFAHYGATKAAQVGYMRTAALELAPHAVTVNAVLPGNIATEGLTALGSDYLATMAASIPLGRLGAVEDVGHAVLFLASDEAGFITGQTLVVDGGQTLPEMRTWPTGRQTD
jgi:3-oxoacyl-[acyl-carrier protein] reductase